MTVNKDKILQELEDDKKDIDTVYNKKKEIKQVKRNNRNEIVSQKKTLVDARGNKLESHFGKRLKRNKHIHGVNHVALAGTTYDEIPTQYRFRFAFTESDFE